MSKAAPPLPPAQKSKGKPAPVDRPPSIVSGVSAEAHKTVIYGAGGVGKTELAGAIKQIGMKPLFFDLDDETQFLDVDRVCPATFGEVLSWLGNDELTDPFGAIGLESLTKAEELASKWVIENIKHPDTQAVVSSIEDYGWGRGYTYIYEAFLKLLAALDRLARKGKHIICTAHDCTKEKLNPLGEDYVEYQPRLQSPREKGKVRERVKEWCDHLLYVQIEAAVADGKAYGDGRRVICTCQMPQYWAKSRVTTDTVTYEKGSGDIWKKLIGGQNA